MPKLKTHTGTKKRFKVTSSGKVKFAKKNRRHILTKKSAKRKSDLRKAAIVEGTVAANVKKLLPYG